MKFTGLGQFRAKKVVKSVDGDESTRTRITFPRAGAKKAGGKDAAEVSDAE